MFEIIGYIATCVVITFIIAVLVGKIININTANKVSYISTETYAGTDTIEGFHILPTITISFGDCIEINFYWLNLYYCKVFHYVKEDEEEYISEAKRKFYKDKHESK